MKEEFYPQNDLIPLEFERGEKQLFIDWHLVEPGYGMPFWPFYQEKYGTQPWSSPHGVQLKLFTPKVESEPIITEDSNGHIGAYCTLLYEDNMYKLWYETYGFEAKGDEGAKISYMQSKDCKKWIKPVLGQIEYNGTYDNNIVYGFGPDEKGGKVGGHGATIFKDLSAPKNEKYKLIHIGPSDEESKLSGWLYGATSPDGINWKKLPDPVLKYMSDTQSVCTYSKYLKKYVLYIRGWTPQNKIGMGGRRFVRRAESDNFKEFKTPQHTLGLTTDFDPSDDIYTNSYHTWPGANKAHIMFPSIYHRNIDTLDLYFAVSRDGMHWEFPKKKPMITNEKSGEKNTICAGQGIVPINKGVWGFPLYIADKCHNEYVSCYRELKIASIREDGFMAIEAQMKGAFYTFPFTFEGRELLINSYTYPGGEIWVEFLEVENLAESFTIKGFGAQDCIGVKGDSLWKPVQWKDHKYISSLTGKTLRMKFYMTRARIYGFMFA